VARERGIDRYYRQVREIRDELDVSHEEARELWSDYYAPGGAPIKPVKKAPPPKLKPTVRVVATNSGTCPFCRDDVPTDGAHACASCQTRYHLDCFQQELGGQCTTLGCMARRNVRRIHVPFVMPTTATTAPTFTVRQEGRDPVQFEHEHDAYRFAAQIIEPGRDVHVGPTVATPPAEEPGRATAEVDQPAPPRDRSFSAFMHHTFGPHGVPILIAVVALLATLLLAFLT
jgi:hypothetical protein